MNTAVTIAPKILQIPTPVLSEFGFSGIQDLCQRTGNDDASVQDELLHPNRLRGYGWGFWLTA